MKTLAHSLLACTLLILLAALSGAAQAAAPAPGVPHRPAGAEYVPGEVLVTLKPGASTAAGKAAVAALGGSTLAAPQPGVLHVKLAPGQSVSAALAAYRSNPGVQAAQPNYIYRTQAAPASSQWGQMWAFNNTGQAINQGTNYVQSEGWIYTTDNPGVAGNDMHIQPAWSIITDCSSVVVAVVDTGVNYNQQDLAANMWVSAAYPNHGTNFVTTEGAANDPMDYNGHGTHVAGIIGASGSVTPGVCWKARIMAVRVADSTGMSTTSLIAQGIGFAVNNGAKVINISMGGGGYDAVLGSAISSAQASDVVVVVAAGNSAANNDSGTTPTYPCNYTQPNLVCVAALDQAFQLATFSNWGATSVDVGAPGVNILSSFAGASTSTTDPLNTGWTFATTTSGGWGYSTALSTTGATINILADPVTSLTGGTYQAMTADTATKSFNLSGVNVAVLNTLYYYDLEQYAFYAIIATNGATSINLNQVNGYANPTWNSVYWSGNISFCISASCSIQNVLNTGAKTAPGVMIPYLNLTTLTWNTSSYNNLNGTSMASPEVAGLAAMLRAYNPNYTYADTVAAIKNAGRATASLSGKTSTGKAVDVMASLAYINPPAGLAAAVH